MQFVDKEYLQGFRKPSDAEFDQIWQIVKRAHRPRRIAGLLFTVLFGMTAILSFAAYLRAGTFSDTVCSRL